MKNHKVYDIKEATRKIQSYCMKQERCQSEVEDKLKQWGVMDISIPKIMPKLILEKFIDEERFCKSFCRGKFKIKKWGKVKILNELKKRNISDHYITKGMQQINDLEYHNTLLLLFEKKNMSIKNENGFIKKGKIAKYLQQKGFEINLIWKLINQYN